MKKKQPTSLSRLQMAALRFIHKRGSIPIEALHECYQTTIWSLVYRKYVTKSGDSLVLTERGLAMYENYMASGIEKRNKPGDLSERVARLLHVARALTKAAAA